MAKADLSLIIPSRNELFLTHTIADALKNIRGNTEIIVGLDGSWPKIAIEDHPKVHIIHHSVSIGQRGICNEMVKYSRAKYIMKVDAHCAFDEGFDVKLLADMQDEWTMVPIMRNLHVFDWVCRKCGDRRYQSPTPTSCNNKGDGKRGIPACDNTSDFVMDVVWIPKTNPQSTAFCFDCEPHFQYFRGYKDRQEYREGIKKGMTETMSLQGSCFLVTRDKFIELDLCDETFGSWGSQGIEVAVKTWLSGGRVVCNQKTWYGHMFRTQGGDFGFPYTLSGRQVEAAKKHARELFFNNKWPKQIRPLSWLVEKFWPVPGWNDDARMAVKEQGRGFERNDTCRDDSDRFRSILVKRENERYDDNRSNKQGQEEVERVYVETSPNEKKQAPIRKTTTGLVFYTDNRLNPVILSAVQKQLHACLNGHKLVSVTLKPLDFGKNIVLPLQRGHLAMAKQQLAGLEALDTDIVFMVEHDILYPACHFDFVPPREDVFYYNLNWWKVRESDGQALHFKAKQVSGLCAYRKILVEYFRSRVQAIESGEIGGRRHFEPGRRHYREEGYNKLTDKPFDTWWSEIPYVDIRHGTTISRNIFDPSGYRGQVVDWTMADEIPSWGRTKGRFPEWLKEVAGELHR